MLSHASMLLSATALLITLEPHRASNGELDCYLEARLSTTSELIDSALKEMTTRLSITSKLIDSALREMTNDMKKQLWRNNQCGAKPISCSECTKTSCESKPTNCGDCERDCIGFSSNTSDVKKTNCGDCERDWIGFSSNTSDVKPTNCSDGKRDCTGFGNCTSDVKPIDCSDVYRHGNRTNGKYAIWPQKWISNEPLLVYCDMETDGGRWTVIQRRGDFGNPSDFFYRGWNEYKTGFGDIEKEFWIGNDNLFTLTDQGSYQIRFDLWDWDGNFKYAIYDEFRVDNESQAYKLHVNGYSGTAGDAFSSHNGMKFSTKDRDNDISSESCSVTRSGAWWYKGCYSSNLNGLYSKSKSVSSDKYVIWNTFHSPSYYALKLTNMKIRPLRS